MVNTHAMPLATLHRRPDAYTHSNVPVPLCSIQPVPPTSDAPQASNATQASDATQASQEDVAAHTSSAPPLPPSLLSGVCGTTTQPRSVAHVSRPAPPRSGLSSQVWLVAAVSLRMLSWPHVQQVQQAAHAVDALVNQMDTAPTQVEVVPLAVLPPPGEAQATVQQVPPPPPRSSSPELRGGVENVVPSTTMGAQQQQEDRKRVATSNPPSEQPEHRKRQQRGSKQARSEQTVPIKRKAPSTAEPHQKPAPRRSRRTPSRPAQVCLRLSSPARTHMCAHTPSCTVHSGGESRHHI